MSIFKTTVKIGAIIWWVYLWYLVLFIDPKPLVRASLNMGLETFFYADGSEKKMDAKAIETARRFGLR